MLGDLYQFRSHPCKDVSVLRPVDTSHSAEQDVILSNGVLDVSTVRVNQDLDHTVELHLQFFQLLTSIRGRYASQGCIILRSLLTLVRNLN